MTDAKGIASVRRTIVGRYCVAVPGISADEVPADVAVEVAGTLAPFGNASVSTVNDPGTGCPNLGDIVVHAMRQPPTDVRNSADNGTTSVAGNAVDSNDVSFTIIVP